MVKKETKIYINNNKQSVSLQIKNKKIQGLMEVSGSSHHFLFKLSAEEARELGKELFMKADELE